MTRNRIQFARIEVTAYRLPDQYAATSTQHDITATDRYRFKLEKEGIRVERQAEIRADGLWKLMLPTVCN